MFLDRRNMTEVQCSGPGGPSAGAYSSHSPSSRRAPVPRRPRLPARPRTMPLYQLVCIAAHIPDYVRPSLLCLRAGADARAPPATHQGPRPPGGDARPGPRGRRAQHPLAGTDDAPAADAPAQARAQHGRVRVSVLSPVSFPAPACHVALISPRYLTVSCSPLLFLVCLPPYTHADADRTATGRWTSTRPHAACSRCGRCSGATRASCAGRSSSSRTRRPGSSPRARRRSSPRPPSARRARPTRPRTASPRSSSRDNALPFGSLATIQTECDYMGGDQPYIMSSQIKRGVQTVQRRRTERKERRQRGGRGMRGQGAPGRGAKQNAMRAARRARSGSGAKMGCARGGRPRSGSRGGARSGGGRDGGERTGQGTGWRRV
jgi:hypothetical protein